MKKKIATSSQVIYENRSLTPSQINLPVLSSNSENNMNSKNQSQLNFQKHLYNKNQKFKAIISKIAQQKIPFKLLCNKVKQPTYEIKETKSEQNNKGNDENKTSIQQEEDQLKDWKDLKVYRNQTDLQQLENKALPTPRIYKIPKSLLPQCPIKVERNVRSTSPRCLPNIQKNSPSPQPDFENIKSQINSKAANNINSNLIISASNENASQCYTQRNYNAQHFNFPPNFDQINTKIFRNQIKEKLKQINSERSSKHIQSNNQINSQKSKDFENKIKEFKNIGFSKAVPAYERIKNSVQSKNLEAKNFKDSENLKIQNDEKISEEKKKQDQHESTNSQPVKSPKQSIKQMFQRKKYLSSIQKEHFPVIQELITRNYQKQSYENLQQRANLPQSEESQIAQTYENRLINEESIKPKQPPLKLSLDYPGIKIFRKQRFISKTPSKPLIPSLLPETPTQDLTLESQVSQRNLNQLSVIKSDRYQIKSPRKVQRSISQFLKNHMSNSKVQAQDQNKSILKFNNAYILSDLNNSLDSDDEKDIEHLIKFI